MTVATEPELERTTLRLPRDVKRAARIAAVEAELTLEEFVAEAIREEVKRRKSKTLER